MHLASVVAGLLPGATLTLASGSAYSGRSSCGWRLMSPASARDASNDPRPITIRGGGAGMEAVLIDCQAYGPVMEGVLIDVHLQLRGIHFTNAFRSGSGGGVLSAELGSTVVLENVRVTNSSSAGRGGCILMRNSSSLVIRGSHFEENTAVENGGSLALVDGVRATVTESIFTRCSGASGGAISMAHGCTIALEGVLFSLNDATGVGGGAVFVGDNCTLGRNSRKSQLYVQ